MKREFRAMWRHGGGKGRRRIKGDAPYMDDWKQHMMQDDDGHDAL